MSHFLPHPLIVCHGWAPFRRICIRLVIRPVSVVILCKLELAALLLGMQ